MTSEDTVRVVLTMKASELLDRVGHITIDGMAVSCIRDFGDVEQVTVTQSSVRTVDPKEYA